MKQFFWLSAGAYVFLYFYAAYIYEGFSMTLAIVLFVGVCGFFFWRHKRKGAKTAVSTPVQAVNNSDTKPLSLWHSPLPYIGILAIGLIGIGIWL